MTVSEKIPDYWLINSGTSHHVSSNSVWFSSYKKFDITGLLRIGNDQCMCAKGIGKILADMLV